MSDGPVSPVKPCPFCGSDVTSESTGDRSGTPFYYRECHSCGACGPDSLESPARALVAWNKRPEDCLPPTEAERLTKERDAFAELCVHRGSVSGKWWYVGRGGLFRAASEEEARSLSREAAGLDPNPQEFSPWV